jgi:hypothetical protein
MLAMAGKSWDDGRSRGDSSMEPRSITCPKCQTEWKIIKAGEGPIACPHCKAIVEPAPEASPAVPTEPQTQSASIAPSADALAIEPRVEALLDSGPRPKPQPPAVEGVPAASESGLKADYDDRDRNYRRRPRMHPLLLVFLLLILVPLAIFILFVVVCAVWFLAG